MNICFINSTKRWGGGEKWHLENAIQLSKHAFNVYIVTNKGSDLEKRAVQQQISTFSIPTGNLSFINPFKLNRFVRFFKKHNIDAVILNGPNDLKLASRAAKIAGVKKIIYRRGSAIPIKNSLLNRYLFKSVVTQIIANSEETKRTILQNLHNTISAQKIQVVYNGFNFDTYLNNISLPKFNSNKVILGNAGRLTYQKGQQDLIELAKQLQAKNIDFEIRIAGNGELKSDLLEAIKKHKLQDQVKLVGFQANIKSFLKDIDIFILPSRWEGFGFVLVEAMALKKPVVAYNISSNPEVVIHNQTGFLSNANNIETLTANTIKLIHSEELRNQFGKNGFNHVMEKFNIENATQQLISLLNPS